MRSRVAVASWVLAVGVLGTGCGSTAPATPLPTASPALTATTSPGPSSGATGGPSGWIRLHAEDPALVMYFPPGWQEYPIADMRARIAALASAATGDVLIIEQWSIAAIDSGRVRFIAGGPASLRGVTTSVTLTVDSGDASLEAAADRWVQDTTAHHAGDLVDRTERTLAIGPAIRLRFSQDPTGGAVPAQSFAYVVRLGDGRTVMITSTSVAQDTGYEDFFESIVATFTLTP